MPPQNKLCPSCGSSMPIAANLCSHCGFNFNAAAQHPYGANPNWNPPGFGGYYRPGQSGSYGAGKEGFAIASLVLGILSLPLFCFWCLGIPCGVLAIIFGVLGKDSSQRGLAIAGIVMGCISVAIAIFFVFLVFAGAATGM